MRVKLEAVGLDRYWRLALPMAAVGVALSGATVALIVVPAEPSDAVPGLVIATVLSVFPVHLGTVLTILRPEPHRGGDQSRDRSAASWTVGSGLGAAVLLAGLRWSDAWTGPDREWLVAAVPGVFHAIGFRTGLRYRRETHAARDQGGPGGPASPGLAASSVPPPMVRSGHPDRSPVGSAVALPRGPRSFPTVEGSGAAADRRSGWPRLIWPRPDPPPRVRRGARSTVPGFVPAVVGALVVTVFVANPEMTDAIFGFSDRDRPFYVATAIAMEDTPFPVEGDLLRAPPDPVWAAACRNYRNFLRDATHGTDLVIVDDAGLVRSAELLDGAYAGDQIAIDAETLLVQEGNLADAVRRMRDEGWPEADVGHGVAYYRDRLDPASAAAHDRYVIFIAATTTSTGVVARLAVDPEHELTWKPAFTRTGDLAVGLPDGSTVRIEESLCWG